MRADVAYVIISLQLPVTIENVEGNHMTPPVVAFNKDWGRSSGIPARCQVVTNPHNTFDSPPPSGALIGQKFEDPEVKREMNMVA